MTYHFFLGGQDLEMVTIRTLLEAEGARFSDKRLAWGARLSHYAPEMEAAIASGETPVAIELADDMLADWAVRNAIIDIDHHGARAQQPASLRQVFTLLALPDARWSRHFDLVAANDTGHVRAMRAFGASLAEMQAIRAADRAAQGITPEEERTGLAALAAGAPVLDGRAWHVRLPHDRAATVTDPHALGPAFTALPRPLLVKGARTMQVFGPRAWIDALVDTFPGSWSGGAGTEGFWGAAGVPLSQVERVLEHL